MINDVIMPIVLAVLGCGVLGDIISRMVFKSSRQKAQAEAQKEENQMWHDRLAEQREATKDLNEIISNLTEDRRKMEEEISDKTRQIRKLNTDIVQLQSDFARKEIQYERLLAVKDKMITWLKLWHCAREDNGRQGGCHRRKPKQPFPMPYEPPQGLDLSHISDKPGEEVKEEIKEEIKE